MPASSSPRRSRPSIWNGGAMGDANIFAHAAAASHAGGEGPASAPASWVVASPPIEASSPVPPQAECPSMHSPGLHVAMLFHPLSEALHSCSVSPSQVYWPTAHRSLEL